MPDKSSTIVLDAKCIDEISAWQTFSIQDQIVNVLSIVGYTVSITATQLCCCSMKECIDTI